MTLLERRRAMMSRNAEIVWDVICLPDDGSEKGYLINHWLDVQAGDTVEFEAYCTSDVANSWHVDARNANGGIIAFTKDKVITQRKTFAKTGYIVVGGTRSEGETIHSAYNAYGYYIKARIIR